MAQAIFDTGRRIAGKGPNWSAMQRCSLRGRFVQTYADSARGRIDLATESPLRGDAVFHAHQAAERAMR